MGILDEKGMKMSKSKGNAIDPLPLIERLGADVFRFWSAGEVTHGYAKVNSSSLLYFDINNGEILESIHVSNVRSSP